jgi:hypothetical protein
MPKKSDKEQIKEMKLLLRRCRAAFKINLQKWSYKNEVVMLQCYDSINKLIPRERNEKLYNQMLEETDP